MHWSMGQPAHGSLGARLVLSLQACAHRVRRTDELGLKCELNPACKDDVDLTHVTREGWEEREPLSCS